MGETESDGELLRRMGTDAAVWADELVKHAEAVAQREGVPFAEVMGDPDPGGFLHGWLCNAIGAGESAGYSAARSEFSRSYLFTA